MSSETSPSKLSQWATSAYQQIDNDYEGRACNDISDQQCKEVPENFLTILFSLLASKLGDTLASAKIVLPWVMASTGAPAFFSALLVPIRESGSMLPQLFLGAKIRRLPRRKAFLVISAILQGACIFGLLACAVLLEGQLAGITILILLSLFSLSRAITSISVKDVIGKTIPKARRGRQSGYAASLAGFASIAFGVVLMFSFESRSGIQWLLILGGVCFLLSGLLYSLLQEYKGATDGGVDGFKEGLSNLRLVIEDQPFRDFVLVRALMMSSSLVAPYFVLLAHQEQDSLKTLGLFIIVSGIADFVSGGIWGKKADQNSKALMRLTAGLTALICFAGAAVQFFELPYQTAIGIGLFFLLSIIHQGVRQGRKTYVVDMAGGTKRTDYVSVSNTVIGFLLLFTGVITGLLAQVSMLLVFLFFASASLLAFMLNSKLNQVSKKEN
ncbi:MAG: MFS transporter [Pseudomonadota bacterium]|nr:MFS transporter [Pseudomonadota bacterium]